ncbi:hypothetical protein [Pontivivens nitratireducens]|uniref:hypothetical protein n=1 Tax=Pontivivens nitratireducens TaxID=2758038 RepID=UPI00163B56DB|nr:hypothetical protein [Pontibrevibacter nitratireducens]
MTHQMTRRAFAASSALVACMGTPAHSEAADPINPITALAHEWLAERERINNESAEADWSDDKLEHECRHYDRMTDEIAKMPATDVQTLALKFIVEIHFGDFEPGRDFIIEACGLAGFTPLQAESHVR